MLIPLKLAFTYFSFANKPTKLMILKFTVHKLWKVKERGHKCYEQGKKEFEGYDVSFCKYYVILHSELDIFKKCKMWK